MYDSRIPIAVERVRIALGFTQAEVAAGSNVPRPRYCLWVNRRAELTVQQKQRVLGFLGVLEAYDRAAAEAIEREGLEIAGGRQAAPPAPGAPPIERSTVQLPRCTKYDSR